MAAQEMYTHTKGLQLCKKKAGVTLLCDPHTWAILNVFLPETKLPPNPSVDKGPWVQVLLIGLIIARFVSNYRTSAAAPEDNPFPCVKKMITSHAQDAGSYKISPFSQTKFRGIYDWRDKFIKSLVEELILRLLMRIHFLKKSFKPDSYIHCY